MATKKKSSTPKMKCTECGKDLACPRNFYKTKSPMFPSGYIPMCKSCIKKQIDYDDMETIYRFFRTIDMPFIIDYWESAEKSKTDTFGKYMTMATGLPQFQGKTNKDSIYPAVDSKYNEVKEDTNETKDAIKRKRLQDRKKRFEFTEEELEEMIDKWGIGYTNEEYYYFENKFNKLIGSYPTVTERHIEALITYVRFRVKADIETAKGNVAEADKWGKLAEKASDKAKINPNQLTKNDLSGGIDDLSEIIKAVEQASDGELDILPKFLEVPQDDVDVTILCIVNYMRRCLGMPDAKYKDLYGFYNDRVNEIKNSGKSTDLLSEEEDDYIV